jgi:mono/diheme cytochrome c family protein
MKKLSLLILFVLILSACGSTPPVVKPTENLPQPVTAVLPATSVPQTASTEQAAPALQSAPVIDGAAIVENQCAQCHSSSRIKQAPRSRDQWDQTVNRMIGKGAVLTDAEKAALIDYLAQNYGK